jgi:hypothetical protein
MYICRCRENVFKILLSVVYKDVDITGRFSGITSMRYGHYQKIGKPNNLNYFGNNYTKGSKQDSIVDSEENI